MGDNSPLARGNCRVAENNLGFLGKKGNLALIPCGLKNPNLYIEKRRAIWTRVIVEERRSVYKMDP